MITPRTIEVLDREWDDTDVVVASAVMTFADVCGERVRHRIGPRPRSGLTPGGFFSGNMTAPPMDPIERCGGWFAEELERALRFLVFAYQERSKINGEPIYRWRIRAGLLKDSTVDRRHSVLTEWRHVR